MPIGATCCIAPSYLGCCSYCGGNSGPAGGLAKTPGVGAKRSIPPAAACAKGDGMQPGALPAQPLGACPQCGGGVPAQQACVGPAGLNACGPNPPHCAPCIACCIACCCCNMLRSMID
eukprot:4608723-Prymnesium_polylepis.1